MALQLADRVQQTGTANTTVSFTLSGILSGFQSFTTGITTGNTLYYAATDGTNWEVGVGTLTNSTTVTRNTCLSSSNSNALVTAFSGTLSIWVDYPASKAVYQDASNNVTLPAQLTAGNYVANETITGALSSGAFSYGTLGYTDVNIFESFTSSVNTYNQCIIQNTNNGNAASTDYVVSNNNGSSTTYYGDFGMNSSGWAGTAGTNSFNAPNMVYLTSTTGDLLLGTTTSNAIRFATNGGADAAQISSTGLFSTTSDATIHTLTVGLGGGSISTNSAFGYQSIINTATGTQNSVFGYNAGKAITSGANNQFFGAYAGLNVSSATDNIAIGVSAMVGNNTSKNIAIGTSALSGSSPSGSSNIGIGFSTASTITSASNSIFIGYQSGSAITSGGNNIFIGYQSGFASTATTTGNNNIYLGTSSHGSAVGNTYEIVIGTGVTGLGSNTTTIGVSGTTALTQVYGTLNTSGYTVSTLPTTAATGKVTGARTYVTDATTLSAGVFGGAVVGGGSVTIPVFYNGTTWIVG